MTKLGKRLIESANEAVAIARGEREAARIFTPPPVDVAGIRKHSGLSQAAFANRYGFSPAAVRDWEQGRRNPDPAARTLLLLIERAPETVNRILEEVA